MSSLNKKNNNYYIESSDSGILNFEELINQLARTQLKSVNSSNLFNKIMGELDTKREYFFGKILSTDNYGNCELYIYLGENTNSAKFSERIFFLSINILREEVLLLKSVDINSINKESVRANKKNRKNIKKNNFIPKEQIILEDSKNYLVNKISENSISVEKKDFSNILEETNSILFSDSPGISVNISQGINKYAKIGVHADRPNINAIIDLNNNLFDTRNYTFNKLLLERENRFETVFNTLDIKDKSDKDLKKVKDSTISAIDTVVSIANIDEKILEDFSIEFEDYSSFLGFSNNDILSQVYLQTIYDIGAVSVNGPFISNNERIINSPNDQIIIDTYYGSSFEQSISENSLRKNNQYSEIYHADSYLFNSNASYLAYTDTSNNANLLTSISNLGNSNIRLDINENRKSIVHLMQFIFSEIILSKLLSSGDERIIEMKEKGTMNISDTFLSNFRDTNQTLDSISAPTDISSIIKFNFSGNNYYPLEYELPDSLNGSSFLESVIQENIGNIIEGVEPDYNILNLWLENSNSKLSDLTKYIDVLHLEGGIPIVFNEIILGTINFIANSDFKVGNKKHPKTDEFLREIEDLVPTQLLSMFNLCIGLFGEQSSQSLAHIYNTIGYCSFEGQNKILSAISSGQNSGLNLTVQEIGNMKIGKGSNFEINPSVNRDPNSNNRATKVLNNIYEEFSRYFTIIENGIMKSASLLLSNKDLISQKFETDYNSFENGIFEIKDVFDISGNKIGNYESTLFSGIPKIVIRQLIATCCKYIVDNTEYTQNFENIRKASQMAVSNLDENLGPVRWKATHGVWPTTTSESELSEIVYNIGSSSILEQDRPELVDSAANQPIDLNSETTQALTEQNFVQAPVTEPIPERVSYSFCPLTLILNDEDNFRYKSKYILANRSIFNDIYSTMIDYRSKVYNMKYLLNYPMVTYKTYPDLISNSISSDTVSKFRDIISLPGVNGNNIIKLLSDIQIGNYRKTLRNEGYSKNLKYLPNKFVITQEEYSVARSFLKQYISRYSNPKSGYIANIGIPTGLLRTIGKSKGYFRILRSAEFMFFPDNIFEKYPHLFHSSIYLIPSSFSQCGSNYSIEEIIRNAKYLISNNSRDNIFNYEQVLQYLNLEESLSNKILESHILDHSIRLYYKIISGTVLDEDTFRISKDINRKYISEESISLISDIVPSIPPNFKDIFNDGLIKPFEDVFNTLPENTVNEINIYLSALENRLISMHEIPRKVFGDRIYDRVFNIFVHPNDHFTYKDGDGLVRSRITDNSYTIDLNNSKFGKHFASYYYRIV